MMQGDACNLSFQIFNNAGAVVTPLDVQDVEITIGHLSKTLRNLEISYQDGLWLFPLTQNETRSFRPAAVKAEVRVLWNSGVIEGKPIYGIRINESISKGVL